EYAQPGQPADHADDIAEDEREVVHVRQCVPGVVPGQEVAQPVTDEVADDGADDPGVYGRAHPPWPGQARADRSGSRRFLRLLRLYLDGHPVTSSSQCGRHLWDSA